MSMNRAEISRLARTKNILPKNPQSNLHEYVLWFVFSALGVRGHSPATMQQDEEMVAMANALSLFESESFCVQDL